MSVWKKRWVIGAGGLLLLGVLGLTSYLFCLAVSTSSRLSHRRWKVPSIVYSDAEILYPGKRLSAEAFIRMLRMRGYRQVAHVPAVQGRFVRRPGHVEVFLRDFVYPEHFFKGFPLKITFANGRIRSLRGKGATLDFATLEPVEVARLYGARREARDLISYREAPKYLVDAIVTIEDRRFFHHRGLDWRGILRAFWVDFRAGRVVQGGSTITQQLAKNYFLKPERSLLRKIREALLSLVLEGLYSKKEILEMYMNEIYLGQWKGVAIRGFGEASQVYFGHDIRNVTLSEAALLAGLIRAPNAYSPFQHRARAIERRNLVLKALLSSGAIGVSQYREALHEPLLLSMEPESGRENLYYVEYVKRQLEKLYSPRALTSEGLRIFTALQPAFQTAAARAIQEGLHRIETRHPSLKEGSTPLQAALIAIRPKTGEIVALSGGRNYAKSPFNRAVDAHRQPGSAFKPFVYLTALDLVTPASVLSDRSVAYRVRGKRWTPRNYDGIYHGRVTVRTALAYSLNAATVNLSMRVGLKKIIATARRLGIHSVLAPYPSLALGAFEVTPLELAGAYCVFANEGQRPYLLTLREVMDERDKSLQRRHVAARTVCTPARAYLITRMLQGVVRRGTARRLKDLGIDFPCAGKTGTTSGYRDSWFVGYTSDLLTLVWVGFDDNRNTHLTGATGAMLIWADFMKKIRRRLNPRPFVKPPGVTTRKVRVDVDWPPETRQPRVYREDFLAGTAPAPIVRSDRGRGRSLKGFFREMWRGLRGIFR